MTVILDIDAMIPDVEYIRFRGADHELRADSTETYLKLLKIRKDLLKAADDEEAQAKFGIDLICLALPSIKREELIKIPLAATMKLTELIEEKLGLKAAPVVQEGNSGQPGESTSGTSLAA